MAVVDQIDSTTCVNSRDYTKNTCRNVVTLNEMINGISGVTLESDFAISYAEPTASTTTTAQTTSGTTATQKFDSAKIREKCLQDAGVKAIRDWETEVYKPYVCERDSTKEWKNGKCEAKQN